MGATQDESSIFFVVSRKTVHPASIYGQEPLRHTTTLQHTEHIATLMKGTTLGVYTHAMARLSVISETHCNSLLLSAMHGITWQP